MLDTAALGCPELQKAGKWQATGETEAGDSVKTSGLPQEGGGSLAWGGVTASPLQALLAALAGTDFQVHPNCTAHLLPASGAGWREYETESTRVCSTERLCLPAGSGPVGAAIYTRSFCGSRPSAGAGCCHRGLGAGRGRVSEAAGPPPPHDHFWEPPT